MTVLDAFSRAQMNLKYQNAFLKRIFWDFQPIVAVPYSTLNVNVPTVNMANVVNIGAGPLQPNPYAFTTVPITLNNNMSNSYIVYDFDQTRIAYDLEQFFFQPKLEELMRSINLQIVGLFTAANYPTYPLFTGTGTNPGQIMRSDITKAWTNLAGVGVPLEDYDNVSLMVQTATYGAMLADQQFIYQYIVGDSEAAATQQRAQLRTIYGADTYYDQQLAPFNVGHNAAILFHRYAAAGVTALRPKGRPAGARIDRGGLRAARADPDRLRCHEPGLAGAHARAVRPGGGAARVCVAVPDRRLIHGGESRVASGELMRALPARHSSLVTRNY